MRLHAGIVLTGVLFVLGSATTGAQAQTTYTWNSPGGGPPPSVTGGTQINPSITVTVQGGTAMPASQSFILYNGSDQPVASAGTVTSSQVGDGPITFKSSNLLAPNTSGTYTIQLEALDANDNVIYTSDLTITITAQGS